MDITIFPGKLSGTVRAIPSKSQAHRLLICAAFADAPTTLFCPETNRDIEATMGCLNALGADITRTDSGYRVIPAKEIPRQTALAMTAALPCGFCCPWPGLWALTQRFIWRAGSPAVLSLRCGRKWSGWDAPSPARPQIPSAAPDNCGRENTSSTAAFPASLLRGCCFPPP